MSNRFRSSTLFTDYTFEIVTLALAIVLLWVTAYV